MRKALMGAVAVAVLFATAGCGTQDDKAEDTGTGVDSPAADARHNAADIMFARMMIPHHEQAIEMAALAESRTQNAELRELAAAIREAQGPEIKKMNGWLEAWGQERMMSDGEMGHMGDMGHGMRGMVDEETMAEMREARGSEFDTLFLESMIEHHEGAIEMAEDEKREGKHAGAKALADAIIEGQSAEIAQMRKMLEG